MHTHTTQPLPLQPPGDVPPGAEALNRPGQADQPDLTENQVLAWADAFHATQGDWPRWDSGPIPGPHDETWFSVSAALMLGRRGFRPGESLAAFFFVRHGRARCIASEQTLSFARIKAWSRAWRKQTGRWPTVHSGEIPGQGGLTWCSVNKILRTGRAGLPAGTNLLVLRRAELQLPERLPLTEQLILEWAKAHYKRTGQWPASTSGRIKGAPAESWLAVSLALLRGSRGLYGHSSLNVFLRKHSRFKRTTSVPSLSISQVLDWADAHHARTGKWPNRVAGPIPQAPAESWRKVNAALSNGSRGLPGGSSLAQLLAARRGVRNCKQPPELSISQILAWADAFHARTGDWPNLTSGPIPEAPGETWGAVQLALKGGARGLPRTPRLSQLLAEHRGWRRAMRRSRLAVHQVLAWAKAFYARTGRWPAPEDGPIIEAAGETWMAVDVALQEGRRGLPRNSSLARLLVTKLAKTGSGSRLDDGPVIRNISPP
jgi:hypothetical protein